MIAAIEEILRRHMGLEASTIGAATVEQVVRARMAAVGAPTTDDYLARLRASPGELDELVESVVVPESWFFRDVMPFATLAEWTRDFWRPAHPVGTLRVLTVPCSTGEEPYSVAIALLGAGLEPDRFTVDAVDISRRALARAARGVYGANSFRGRDLDFRDRCFTAGPEGYTVLPALRRPVRFAQGNILDASFRPGAGRFDVVFCRNLLIYFDRPTQSRAMAALARLLADDGLLFVGHAETGMAAQAGFAPTNYPMSFAFHKGSAATRVGGVAASAGAATVTTRRLPAQMTTRRLFAPRQPGPPRPPVTRLFTDTPAGAGTVRPNAGSPEARSVSKAAALDAARALADQGKLGDAGRVCEDVLRQNASSAAAWYLLGVVRDAAGDRSRAAECFAKTLYLEPDHQEALLQRALHAEQTGDLAAAERFRRRIARVQERSGRP